MLYGGAISAHQRHNSTVETGPEYRRGTTGLATNFAIYLNLPSTPHPSPLLRSICDSHILMTVIFGRLHTITTSVTDADSNGRHNLRTPQNLLCCGLFWKLLRATTTNSFYLLERNVLNIFPSLTRGEIPFGVRNYECNQKLLPDPPMDFQPPKSS